MPPTSTDRRRRAGKGAPARAGAPARRPARSTAGAAPGRAPGLQDGPPPLHNAQSTAPVAGAARETLVVTEIFHSIQGESTYAGRPCVFVRLTGCHLRCRWCDTAYAFTQGQRMPIDSVIERVDAFACDLVEITGGEPLLQDNVHPLMERLLDSGKTVLLETSGALRVDRVDPRVVKIVDVKCPGSGEVEANCWANLERLGPRDEIKFVIADRPDYLWARDVIARHDLARRCCVLFSPVHGELAPVDLARWVLADGLSVRLQLQIHKHIWPPETRGV